MALVAAITAGVLTSGSSDRPGVSRAASLSGPPVVGQVLHSSTGTWTNSPTSFSYIWADCDTSGSTCSNIPGATQSAYTVASSDVGHTIVVVVTATNAGGSASQSSAPTGVVQRQSSGCTVTDSTLAQVVTDSSSQPNGATICIAPGSYGQLNLVAARSGYVTIAGNRNVTLSGLDVSSAAGFLHLDGLTITANSEFGTSANDGTAPHDIQVTNTVSQGFQVEAGAVNYLFDHDTSQGGPYGFLLNGSRHPVDGGCCSTANYPLIQNVTISNSLIGPVGSTGADAFQVKGFDNVTISHNEINDIYQNGNHNDGIQTVHGGSNLTITHNWFHGGNVELFMLKDGDITGTNTITDNLVDNSGPSTNPPCGGCSTSVFGQYYSPQNATISNNTIIDIGLFLRSQLNLVGGGNPPYLPPSNINVNHNVINQFRAQDDDQGGALGSFSTAMSHSFNLLGNYSKNYLTAGTGDAFTASINDTSSIFINPAANDFRLASNPNGEGVDWVPDPASYGPQ